MSPSAVVAASIDPTMFERAVRAATGWPGLGVIFVYSFLIAFVLPFPSEVVLCSAGYVCAESAHLGLGIPSPLVVLLVVLASSLGKATGSVIALYLGHGASHSGPVLRAARRLGFEPMQWSKRRMIVLVRQYGYYGMAMGLSVPGFPDTLSIYVFSVIEKDYRRFAAAAFTGSVGRLAITIAALESALVVI